MPQTQILEHKKKDLSLLSPMRLRLRFTDDCDTSMGHGKLSVDAGEPVRNTLIKAAASDITKKILKLEKQGQKPREIAEKLVQDYDIVPIRQLMTVHDVHEPVFVRKVKSSCEAICKKNEDTLGRFFDTKMFRHAVGKTMQKVTNAALLDPDMSHKPKDLAAACFIQTLKKMRPGAIIQLKHTPQKSALRYVNYVMSPKWSESLATWKGKKEVK